MYYIYVYVESGFKSLYIFLRKVRDAKKDVICFYYYTDAFK